MKQAQLKELSGNSRLGRDFFNAIIRRIECSRPIAGKNVTLDEKENGIIINAKGSLSGGFGEYSELQLNVCSNGTPAVLTVLGKS